MRPARASKARNCGEVPAVQVTPAHDSALEQWHARYPELKAAAEAANAALKECTDAIKAELTAAAPEQGRVDMASPYGPPMYLTWVVSKRIDSGRLKAEHPEIAEAYTKESGAWQLKSAGQS